MSAALILTARDAMLERAARAMCARHCGQCGIADTEAYFARTRDDYIAEAAAVLDSVGAAELLEGLKATYDTLCISYPLHSSDMDKRGGILAQARAAISKAEGAA